MTMTPPSLKLRRGSAPTPNTGPSVGATSGSTASGGGTNVVTVSSGGGPFQTVFVSTGSGSAAASALGRGRAETVASCRNHGTGLRYGAGRLREHPQHAGGSGRRGRGVHFARLADGNYRREWHLRLANKHRGVEQ